MKNNFYVPDVLHLFFPHYFNFAYYHKFHFTIVKLIKTIFNY